MANPRAYLLRAATNLWIDQERRRGEPELPFPESAQSVAGLAREAGERLFERVSPQERAAVVLKDVFELSLEEIADALSTTVGAIKAALHRGRERLRSEPTQSPRRAGPSRELVDRFVEAFNARDVGRVTAILQESVTIEVLGVGGGRRRDGVWVSSSLAEPNVRAAALELQGEWIVATVLGSPGGDVLVGLTRFEEVDARVARIKSYGYCPETLSHVAAALGLRAGAPRHHQPPSTLERMISSTTLP